MPNMPFPLAEVVQAGLAKPMRRLSKVEAIGNFLVTQKLESIKKKETKLAEDKKQLVDEYNRQAGEQQFAPGSTKPLSGQEYATRKQAGLPIESKPVPTPPGTQREETLSPTGQSVTFKPVGQKRIVLVNKLTGEMKDTGERFEGKEDKYIYYGESEGVGIKTGKTEQDIINTIEDNARQDAKNFISQTQEGMSWDMSTDSNVKGKVSELATNIARVKSYRASGKIPKDQNQTIMQIMRDYQYLKNADVPVTWAVEEMKNLRAPTQTISAVAVPAAAEQPIQSEQTDIDSKASKFLIDNGQADTPANRKWAIDSGYIK